jgi:RNA polymerase sigma-70 factor, ECF subfamily
MSTIAQGDRQAFRRIVERYAKRAYAVAFRLLYNRSDAEDLTQEAFAKLWVSAPLWEQEKGEFSTWFYRILTNACIDSRRKKKPVALDQSMEITDPAPGAEQQLSGKQTARRVQRAIEALPERQQVALTLCYYEEFSNQEAADIMGIHIKALEGLLARARKTLRVVLAAEEVSV